MSGILAFIRLSIPVWVKTEHQLTCFTLRIADVTSQHSTEQKYLEQEMAKINEAFYALNTFYIKAGGEIRMESANILAHYLRIPNFRWGFKSNRI